MNETEKQLAYIRFIESETGIPYQGKSKADASQYITKNKDKIHIDSAENMWAIIKGY